MTLSPQGRKLISASHNCVPRQRPGSQELVRSYVRQWRPRNNKRLSCALRSMPKSWSGGAEREALILRQEELFSAARDAIEARAIVEAQI